jgi:hypothetical protein
MQKLAFFLFSLFVFSLQDLTPDQYLESFNSWVQAYGKNYATQAKSDAAYQNYLQVLENVAQHNSLNLPFLYEQPTPPIAVNKKRSAGPAPVTLAVNSLSDVSPAEFTALYGGEIIGTAATAGAVSVAVIVGSIVGAIVGTAAVAGTVGGVIYYRKKKSTPALESQPNPTYVAPSNAPTNGIDIHNFHRGISTSITARAPPRVV